MKERISLEDKTNKKKNPKQTEIQICQRMLNLDAATFCFSAILEEAGIT